MTARELQHSLDIKDYADAEVFVVTQDGTELPLTAVGFQKRGQDAPRIVTLHPRGRFAEALCPLKTTDSGWK